MYVSTQRVPNEFAIPDFVEVTNSVIENNNFCGGDGLLNFNGLSFEFVDTEVIGNGKNCEDSERMTGSLTISRALKQTTEVLHLNVENLECRENFANLCSCILIYDLNTIPDAVESFLIVNASDFIENDSLIGNILFNTDPYFSVVFTGCSSFNNYNNDGNFHTF